MRIPLIGGAYQARSVIANAQRCLNLYPEVNRGDSLSPTTHYQTPGLRVLARPPVPGAGRCAYRASNGDLYVVIGSGVYYVDPVWSLHLIGNVPPGVSPVKMSDNGQEALIVLGSNPGYVITLATRTFAQYTDPSFLGADWVGYLDTFLLLNEPNTRNIYSTLSNVLTIDSTYIAAKNGFPDLLVAVVVAHREAWLLGAMTSEVWIDAGNPLFPFAPIPGVFIDAGCAARFSPAIYDQAIFWLGQNKDGEAIVYVGQQYRAQAISTYAISNEISKYGTIKDAIGFTYQQAGHTFYVLTFPSADKTWVFDFTTNEWHERCWLDGDGIEHRWRISACTFANGTNVGLDWENGNLYVFDLETQSDFGGPKKFVRSFPCLMNDGKRVIYNCFTADIEVGSTLAAKDLVPDDLSFRSDEEGNEGVFDLASDTAIAPAFNDQRGTEQHSLRVTESDPMSPPPSQPEEVFLRYSIDRGKTWSDHLPSPLGAVGDFSVQPSWRRLGASRSMVFELSWSGEFLCAMNGGFVDFELCLS